MKRSMIILLGFLLVFGAGYYLLLNNEDGKQREVRIVQEYQAIKHPEGAKLVNYELGRKIIMRWVSTKYIYNISNEEVQKYYEQELVRSGWRQIPYNSRPGDMYLAYVKDNLELVLGLHKDNVWSLYIHYVDAKY